MSQPIAPLTTLPEILLSTLIFIPLWLFLRHIVLTNGPFKYADTLLFYHNILQVILSLFILAATTLSILPPIVPLQPLIASVQAEHSFLPRYTYHLSKVYEYTDVLLFISRGGHAGKADTDLHFAFHHLTTPYLTLFRFLQHYEGWRVFASLNAGHHVLMYAFFVGASRMRKALLWTRWVQLVVGIACDGWVGLGKVQKGEEIWPNLFSAGLLACYLGLLVREVQMKRIKEESDDLKEKEE